MSDREEMLTVCLDAIERNGYDSFTRRASLGWSERAMVLGRAFLNPAAAPALACRPAPDEGAAITAA